MQQDLEAVELIRSLTWSRNCSDFTLIKMDIRNLWALRFEDIMNWVFHHEMEDFDFVFSCQVEVSEGWVGNTLINYWSPLSMWLLLSLLPDGFPVEFWGKWTKWNGNKRGSPERWGRTLWSAAMWLKTLYFPTRGFSSGCEKGGNKQQRVVI